MAKIRCVSNDHTKSELTEEKNVSKTVFFINRQKKQQNANENTEKIQFLAANSEHGFKRNKFRTCGKEIGIGKSNVNENK